MPLHHEPPHDVKLPYSCEGAPASFRILFAAPRRRKKGRVPAVREHEGAVLETPAATSEAPTSLLHKERCRHCVDTLGIEPRAFRMQSGCDTTTPCAHMRVKSRCVRGHRKSAFRRWSHRQDNNLHCGLRTSGCYPGRVASSPAVEIESAFSSLWPPLMSRCHSARHTQDTPRRGRD